MCGKQEFEQINILCAQRCFEAVFAKPSKSIIYLDCIVNNVIGVLYQQNSLCRSLLNVQWTVLIWGCGGWGAASGPAECLLFLMATSDPRDIDVHKKTPPR